MKIQTEFYVETEDGKELTFLATAKATPVVPAVLNPVDRAHPVEGGDVEDVELMLEGKSISMKDAIEMGLNEAELLEKLSAELSDLDDFPDEDGFRERLEDE